MTLMKRLILWANWNYESGKLLFPDSSATEVTLPSLGTLLCQLEPIDSSTD